MKKSLLSLLLLMPHLIMASTASDFEDKDKGIDTHNLATALNLPTIDADLTEQQIMMGKPLTEFITFDDYESLRASDEIVSHFLTEFMNCDLETLTAEASDKTLFCGHVAFWTVMNGFSALDPNEAKVKDLLTKQGVDHMVAMSKAQLPFTEDGFQKLKTFQNALLAADDASFTDLNESYFILTNVGLTEKQQQDVLFTALKTHFSENNIYREYFQDAEFLDLFLLCYDHLSEIMLYGYGLIKRESDDDISDDEEPVTRIIVDEQLADFNFVEAYESQAQLIEAAANTISDKGSAPAA